MVDLPAIAAPEVSSWFPNIVKNADLVLIVVDLEQLREAVYEALDIIRVHTEPPGGKANLTEPSVVSRGSIAGDMAQTVHKDFARNLKYSQVWGSGKFDGQRIRRDYILQDGNIVKLHM